MLTLNHRAKNIARAFYLTSEGEKRVTALSKLLIRNVATRKRPITWAINRIWIDEILTENERCFLVFSLGRLYEDAIEFFGEDKGGEK